MVKLVVVLSGLHQGDHSLPMNYFCYHFFITKNGFGFGNEIN